MSKLDKDLPGQTYVPSSGLNARDWATDRGYGIYAMLFKIPTRGLTEKEYNKAQEIIKSYQKGGVKKCG